MSTPKEKRVLADIKFFYLNNALPDPEYMKFHISTIPQGIIDEYNLLDIVDNHSFLYVKIVKGMYRLKQASIISHKYLVHHLAPFGYHPARHTPVLWQHKTRDTIFTLVVDNFAIKYTSLENAKHLLNALQAKYTISEDWEAKTYISITLKWDYIKRTFDLSMPGYVTAALLCFRHQLKNKKQLSPHHHVAPTYGATVQFAEPEDDAPLLPEECIKFIQKSVGVFLYYSIDIDNTVLVALSDIGSEQYIATFKNHV